MGANRQNVNVEDKTGLNCAFGVMMGGKISERDPKSIITVIYDMEQ